MKNSTSPSRWLSWILACASSLALAQEPSPNSGEDTIKLRFLGWEKTITDLYLVSGKNLVPLSITAYEPSAFVTLPAGSPEVRVVRKIQKDKGEEIQTVATAALTGKSTGAFVIMLPNKLEVGSTDPLLITYRLLLYQDNPKEFPVKSLRIINILGETTGIRVGNDKFELPFPSSRVVPLKLDKLGRAMAIAAVNNGTEWNVLYKNLISISDKQRVTLLLTYSPTGAAAPMNTDDKMNGEQRSSKHFALLIYDDVLNGNLVDRQNPDSEDEGGVVTEDRKLPSNQ